MSSALKNTQITLGIETSCDETALALIATPDKFLDSAHNKDSREVCVLSSIIHSQAALHSTYGGVFPTIAKREHGKNIVGLFHKLLIEAQEYLSHDNVAETHWTACIARWKETIAPQNPELFETFSHAEFLKKRPAIHSIAVTEGPGLEPALWVGITFARMLGELWNIPVRAVNHMEGHIVGSLLPSIVTNGAWHRLTEPLIPAVALLISGGHTELIKVSGPGEYTILGETVDDAVGEAFDKAARLLGLPYPGGPHLSRLAEEARKDNIPALLSLPRPMLRSGDLTFSFSGLKTAVLYSTRTAPKINTTDEIEESWKKGLAREFEDAVTETLDTKLRTAIEKTGAQSIIVGGGVSANTHIREQLTATAKEYGIPLFLPSHHISGDNALMIALASVMNPHSFEVKELKADGTKKLGK